jgi:hypothetical protein
LDRIEAEFGPTYSDYSINKLKIHRWCCFFIENGLLKPTKKESFWRMVIASDLFIVN